MTAVVSPGDSRGSPHPYEPLTHIKKVLHRNRFELKFR